MLWIARHKNFERLVLVAIIVSCVLLVFAVRAANMDHVQSRWPQSPRVVGCQVRPAGLRHTEPVLRLRVDWRLGHLLRRYLPFRLHSRVHRQGHRLRVHEPPVHLCEKIRDAAILSSFSDSRSIDSCGLMEDRGSFFQDPWNLPDFIILISMWLEFGNFLGFNLRAKKTRKYLLLLVLIAMSCCSCCSCCCSWCCSCCLCCSCRSCRSCRTYRSCRSCRSCRSSFSSCVSCSSFSSCSSCSSCSSRSVPSSHARPCFLRRACHVFSECVQAITRARAGACRRSGSSGRSGCSSGTKE